MRRALCIAALLVGFSFHAQTSASAEAPPPEACVEPSDEDPRVNINTATAEELVKLPSIGPSRAQAIIGARAERLFRRVEDILRVHGIGRKTFRQLKESIRVE